MRTILAIALALATVATVTAMPLDPEAPGVGTWNYNETYDELLDALHTGGAIQNLNGQLLVPWYSTSSSCTQQDLQRGGACQADVDNDTYCMVSDEFSQVGLLTSMGEDEERMERFLATVEATPSAYGDLMSWRVLRDGDSLLPCAEGINGNCDAATDADARIALALLIGSKNDAFSQEAKERYLASGVAIAEDIVEHELENTCYPTGQGEVCWWLAAGPGAKQGGISSWDYSYTGYYPDTILAMLAAHAATGNATYAEIAEHLTRSYLHAARFDGQRFTTPPGKAFRWRVEGGVPQAECTSTCYPVMWDNADAPRALGICRALPIAEEQNITLGSLQQYCEAWQETHLKDSTKAPLQYTPEGQAAVAAQSGYFAQGLQALFHSGASPQQFETTLREALNHYSPQKRTWDWTACHGVYTQTFPIRALGVGLGRDARAYTAMTPSTPVEQPEEPPEEPPVQQTNTSAEHAPYSGISSLIATATAPGGVTLESDTTSGSCRTAEWSTDSGRVKLTACDKQAAVEGYRQAQPGGAFEACLGNVCVDEWRGWVRVDIREVETGATVTVEEPQEPVGPATPTSIEELPITCSGSACTLVSDTTTGDCRTITHSVPQGTIRTMGCEKGSAYEHYRHAYPAGASARVCLGAACVDQWSGWSRATF